MLDSRINCDGSVCQKGVDQLSFAAGTSKLGTTRIAFEQMLNIV